MYKKNTKIMVKVISNRYISQLGISGPIVNPISIPAKTALDMVNAGVEVHQYDPVSGRCIRLTVSNVMDDTKFAPKTNVTKTPVANTAPQKSAPQKPSQPTQFTGAKVENKSVEAAKAEAKPNTPASAPITKAEPENKPSEETKVENK